MHIDFVCPPVAALPHLWQPTKPRGVASANFMSRVVSGVSFSLAACFTVPCFLGIHVHFLTLALIRFVFFPQFRMVLLPLWFYPGVSAQFLRVCS